MDFKNKTILFLGDSITEGACAIGEENVYHQVAARLLGASTVIDGIGGTRMAKQKKVSDEPRFDNELPKRFDEHGHIYDFIVVFGGVNDFGHGDAPFGNDGDSTSDTFVGAVDLLCRKIKKTYGNNAVFILPMHNIHENDPHGEYGQKPISGKLLREYGLKIKEIADSYDFYILDLWNDPLLDPNIEGNSELFADGLHPTNEGHRILGKRVADFLLNI